MDLKPFPFETFKNVLLSFLYRSELARVNGIKPANLYAKVHTQLRADLCLVQVLGICTFGKGDLELLPYCCCELPGGPEDDKSYSQDLLQYSTDIA